jgi:hypothetical protein
MFLDDTYLKSTLDFTINCAVSGKGCNDVYSETGSIGNCFGSVSFKFHY